MEIIDTVLDYGKQFVNGLVDAGEKLYNDVSEDAGKYSNAQNQPNSIFN